MQMDIASNRRRALQALVERRFGGVQAKFGTAIGRQADYVSRLLSGKKALGEGLAREIEDILRLERGELDREPTSEAGNESGKIRQLGGRTVPILAWENFADISAGPLMNAARLAVAYVPQPSGVSDHAYALPVRGGAMEPEFRDGWLIYVDDAIPCKHGDYVVARPAGMTLPLLRQLVIEGDSTYLRATNPAYPDTMLPLGDGTIVGRVVYQAKAY
jgi:SOS-response transcriptional repressor LexA